MRHRHTGNRVGLGCGTLPAAAMLSSSKMMSRTPTSLENRVASSIALASASKGPKASGMHLLMPETTEPS